MGQLTELLLRANAGDESARMELFASAYGELRLLAHSRLRDTHNTLLDTTALVHESFVRFVQAGRLEFKKLLGPGNLPQRFRLMPGEV